MSVLGGLLDWGRVAKKEKEKSREGRERTGWVTRLRKSGKKDKSRGRCVSVLGGLLG